jgi:hypothetical protein
MKAIEDLMKDFNPTELQPEHRSRGGKPVTIWLSAETKARYDKIQKLSQRRFNQKLREIIEAALEVAEKKAG